MGSAVEIEGLSLEKSLLVIPLYNHAAGVGGVVRAACATGMEVLVVDDGSTDDGLAVVHRAAGDCRRVHTLQQPRNKGKGEAILAAARWAQAHGFTALVTVDADGQHDPAEAPQLVAAVAAWPAVVIGNRRMEGENVPESSLFGRRFSNFWVRLECGAELADTQSGFRLYPVAELLALDFSTRRYDFEIELLVKLVWGGVAVAEVAISVHYPPPEERISHFDKLRDNLRLSLLHSRLVCRRLLPWPHRRLVAAEEKKEPLLEVRHPLRTLGRLCREHASPFWLAVAVWMGFFLGAVPLIACHTLVIIYVTRRLHLNTVAAVAASQFCMPPVMPVLCIETGHFLLSGELLLEGRWEVWVLELHHRLLEWLAGSLVIGPVAGLLGGTLVWLAARRLQRRRQCAGE